MSNLDTTLREKFIAEFPHAFDHEDQYNLNRDEVIEWWLAEFHQLMNEKRESIKKLKEPDADTEYLGWELYEKHCGKCCPGDDTWAVYKNALDDVLSILKD